MKNLTLALLLIPTLSFAQVKSSGKSTKSPWGGTWWAMHAGQLALGWRNNEGRTWRDKDEALAFDKCLVDTSKAWIKSMAQVSGQPQTK
jgi:hypothetical protein